MSPLPASFISEMLRMNGVKDIEVVDVSAFDAGQIVEEVRSAHFIIGDFTFQRPITRAVAEAARQVKLIQQPSVGYQHIDIAACKEFGIKVANTAGANTVGVAEHTIMTALCLLKNTMYAARTTAAGEWRQMEVRPVELSGKTWGFLGFGRIGRAVAQRLIAFGLSMIYYDPFRLESTEEQRHQVTYATKENVLRQADVLSLHCPLTPETTCLINRQNISLMKTGAVIINASRGEVIEETALAEALRDGRIGGAALDVFSTEPIIADNPLLAMAGDKVILSPHVAGVTQEAQGRIINMTFGNIVKVMNGQRAENLVA